MDRATAERIFESFFTTKGIGSGTGLGLSVAHGIVTEHGSAISAQSATGSGTTFEVLLPILRGAAAEPAVPERADTPTGKGCILFVDDESALVTMAEKVLGKLGYTVLGETDSSATLARFREGPGAIDLVITDQTMPGLTGDALTRELRKIRADVMVIVCTGYSSRYTPEMAEEMGIAGYLKKPILPNELGQVVGRALGR